MSTVRWNRPLFAASLVLAVGLFAVLPIALEMPRSYRGLDIVLRPWMVTYNSVILGVHAVALGLLLVGLRRGAERLPNGRYASAVATGCIGLALTAVIAMLLFPLVLGIGPFSPASTSVKALRVMTFLPGVARTVAIAAFLFAVSRAPATHSPGRTRAIAGLVLVLTAADAALSIQIWSGTPHAVIARLHACDIWPWLFTPGLISLLALPWLRVTDNR